MKAVFHIDESDKWAHALANLTNFLAEVPDAQLVLVANGEAITGYTDARLRTKMQALSQVSFHACQNSMNAHQLTTADLPDYAVVVPAGVVDLAQLQADHFAYIKP